MRKLLFVCIFCFLFISVRAQLFCPTPYGKFNGDVKRYHITAGYGFTALYGDIDAEERYGNSGFIKFDYQIIKGIYVGVEGQTGILKNRGALGDRRFVNNKYNAFGFVMTTHIFDLLLNDKNYSNNSFGENLLDGIYVGVGILGLRNNYKSIFRDEYDYKTNGPIERDNQGNFLYDSNGKIIFKEKLNSITLPTLNFGVAIPLIDNLRKDNYFSIVLNSQFNFNNNDELDGYIPYSADAKKVIGNKDFYNFYSAGLRYSF